MPVGSGFRAGGLEIVAQRPLDFYILYLVFVLVVFSSVKLLLCVPAAAHYLFDTLNTDRTRAGADPITSSFLDKNNKDTLFIGVFQMWVWWI